MNEMTDYSFDNVQQFIQDLCMPAEMNIIIQRDTACDEFRDKHYDKKDIGIPMHCYKIKCGSQTISVKMPNKPEEDVRHIWARGQQMSTYYFRIKICNMLMEWVEGLWLVKAMLIHNVSFEDAKTEENFELFKELVYKEYPVLMNEPKAFTLKADWLAERKKKYAEHENTLISYGVII